MSFTLSDLRQLWTHPPREFSPAPFWFWNGELDPDELRRQMAEFRARGVWCVIPHARVPLPESVGWLTPRWFACFDACVAEARATGMTLYLYDEGMYPSGSAGGRVTEGRPELRCQGLARIPRALAEAQELPEELRQRRVERAELVAAEGEWAYVRVYPNTGIRGLGYGPPPLAADLLNPTATARFLQFAYEPYRERYAPDFGRTILGMFTDEPALLGRGRPKELRPWTAGFAEYFRERNGWDLLPHLGALWETGEETAAVRAVYRETVDALLDEAYYRPLAEWCEQNGLVLTGHPSGEGELGHLRWFQLPGQDVVWKQVTCEPTAAGGPDSVLGKIGSSAAHLWGRARNANELYGAYGWELTVPETKWLADWLLVRGVNLLIPHAFYYTLEGEAKFERPPDVGPGNLWWPWYGRYAGYVTRLSALLSQGRHVCDIAVYDQGNQTSPRAGYWLLQLQRDFDYLERSLLEAPECVVEGGQLCFPHGEYRVLVLDGVERLPVASMRRLHAFQRGGGIALALGGAPRAATSPGDDAEVARLAAEVWPAGTEAVLPAERRALGRLLDRWVPHDARLTPPSPHLRVLHCGTSAGEVYFFTNESAREEVLGVVTPRGPGRPERWDPETGESTPLLQFERDGTSVSLPLHLRPAESCVVVLTREPDPVHCTEAGFEVEQVIRERDVVRVTGWSPVGGELAACARDGRLAFRGAGVIPPPPASRVLTGLWRVVTPEGERGRPDLTSWTEWYEARYAGSLVYETEFYAGPGEAQAGIQWVLDLGQVAEFASVALHDAAPAVRLWPPWRWPVAVRPGANRLRVEVWNSRANELEGQGRPSGLLGPVVLEARRRVELTLMPAEPPPFPVSVIPEEAPCPSEA